MWLLFDSCSFLTSLRYPDKLCLFVQVWCLHFSFLVEYVCRSILLFNHACALVLLVFGTAGFPIPVLPVSCLWFRCPLTPGLLV